MGKREKGGEIVLDSNDSPLARRISRQPTGKSVLIGDRAANFRRHRSFSVSRLNATSSPSSSLSYFLNERSLNGLSLRAIPRRLACFFFLPRERKQAQHGELKSCNREVVNWNRRKGKRVGRSMKSLLGLRNPARSRAGKENLNSSR